MSDDEVPWPEPLEPYDPERVKCFSIDSYVLLDIMTWLMSKRRMPLFPSVLSSRERDGHRTRLSALAAEFVERDVLQVFREYANGTNACWGLRFRSFPVCREGAQALLRVSQEVFDSIKTYDDFLDFLFHDPDHSGDADN
jgi:hypothetical protein